MPEGESKKLLKYFLVIFLIAFLTINWSEVSWVFNYGAVFGLTTEFLEKTNLRQIGLAEKDDKFEFSDKENILEIPRIGISVPLIFPQSPDMKEVIGALERGAVHFPNSSLPGKPGQTIILGHSAPPGWPKIQYQWIFSEINALQEGDEVIAHFDNKKLKYSVRKKIFLEKGEELPQALTNSENVLVLVSCWPPGKDIRRIAVLAEAS
jgi:LPXTG-site transpeptidase (sortase) family protein